VRSIAAHPSDWLALGGDVGEEADDLRFVLDELAPRFARILWVPGNHELWTLPSMDRAARGEAKYRELVEVCRMYGALTPEDPYPVFDDGRERHLVAPLFVLYDYSFCPQGQSPERARAWARETGVECTDEHLLHPDPYPSREAWCRARCDYTEQRLTEAVAGTSCRSVLINHFPLLPQLAVLPLAPRFSIWCGTLRTRDWHRRFRASVVVYGHLHIRGVREIDNVRFEEVSLGYPRQWRHRHDASASLCQILPRDSKP
jgi:3',5'-cyclic AMP phosphodiesterase CpdA